MDKVAKFTIAQKHVLSVLATNCRMTQRELAKRVKRSPGLTNIILKRIFRYNVVTPYFDVNTRKLGWQISFYAIVGLESQTLQSLNAFTDLVQQWPEVRECHMVRSGNCDFMLKIIARDRNDQIRLFSALAELSNVERVQQLDLVTTSFAKHDIPFLD